MYTAFCYLHQVKYRKLKDKVSKIKSHLSVEDIIKLNQLDQQGKLKPAYKCVVLSSAMKIAAASRRLNLNSDRYDNKRSLPTISIHGDTSDLKRESSISLSNAHVSEMANGVFTDTSPQHNKRRPQTASVIRYSSASRLPGKMHPLTKQAEDSPASDSPGLSVKKETLAVPEANHVTLPEEKGGRMLRAHSAFPHSHSPFSSHVSAAKDAREGLSTAPEQYNNMRRLSHISRDSIDR